MLINTLEQKGCVQSSKTSLEACSIDVEEGSGTVLAASVCAWLGTSKMTVFELSVNQNTEFRHRLADLLPIEALRVQKRWCMREYRKSGNQCR